MTDDRLTATVDVLRALADQDVAITPEVLRERVLPAFDAILAELAAAQRQHDDDEVEIKHYIARMQEAESALAVERAKVTRLRGALIAARPILRRWYACEYPNGVHRAHGPEGREAHAVRDRVWAVLAETDE